MYDEDYLFSSSLYVDAYIRRSRPETSLLFKTILIVISPAFVTQTSKRSLYKTIPIIIVPEGWTAIAHGPHHTWTTVSEYTASHMDRSSVDSKPCLSRHKVSPNACTASPLDLVALTLLNYCSLCLAEGIPSVTYIFKCHV